MVFVRLRSNCFNSKHDSVWNNCVVKTWKRRNLILHDAVSHLRVTYELSQSNYTASKAGVVAMTKTAAKELGKFNVRVNVVLPGFINTPIIKTVPEKVMMMMLMMVPLARVGEPEEVAEVIAFLSSDKSSFMTGATIDVTGGF